MASAEPVPDICAPPEALPPAQAERPNRRRCGILESQIDRSETELEP